MADLPTALYEPAGEDRYASTQLTAGPWHPALQHAGPPSALLARAAARTSRLAEGRFGALRFDILRPVPVTPVRVTARVARPGRRVEIVEAELCGDDGTALMRLSAWRLAGAVHDALPADLLVADPPPARPHDAPPGSPSWWRADVAYHRALDWRFSDGNFDEPGPATVWTRLLVPLVADEPPTPVERLLVMADAASGISATLDWTTWTFVNVDLTIHLEREPRSEWVAMAARTRPGPEGAGVCHGILYDERGRVGLSAQSLFIAPR